jgi:hypothetical protein
MSQSPLISEQYLEMQRKLHENPKYGMSSVQFAEMVAAALEATGSTELLDYGAGKGRLGQSLTQYMRRPVQVHCYDPAIPEWAATPKPCQFVACIDVLEHIEPDRIDNVLDDLQRVTLGFGMFTIHTMPAQKVLPDGRNAHLIQQPASWWLPRLLARFELVKFDRLNVGFWVGVERLKT